VISVLAVAALVIVSSVPSIASAFRIETPLIAAAIAAALTGMAAVAITGILRATLRAVKLLR
jgi:hypothetical protein